MERQNNYKTGLTLLELNGLVRETLEISLPNDYWVQAELSECRESRGHCFMELIQREEGANVPVARASAKCWASIWYMLRPYFERTTGQQLHAGMKVLLKVHAQFHEAYGFSWIVTDIDPAYTLGDQARRRQEIIRQLKAEGVFDLQKGLRLPLCCLRIAVISSQTAAGYGDFCKQLSASAFAFSTTLFPAIMQGEETEQSIIAALDQVFAMEDDFDCVVIIRGGGATADMTGFDTLALAEHVANFPLPVITGIGHDRDECVLDLVSFMRVKTPTAAASYLIDHAMEVLVAIEDFQNRIVRNAQQRLADNKTKISNLNTQIASLFSLVKTRHEAILDRLFSRMLALSGQFVASRQSRLDALCATIPVLAARRLEKESHRLELTTEKLKALDPQLLLKRGYSITLKDGHAIHDPAQLTAGDLIQTRLEKGVIYSTVNV